MEENIILTPRHTGVLAALGLDGIEVMRKPVIALLSTGDEIIPAGQNLEPGRVYDINSQTLFDSLAGLCQPIHLGIVPDDEEMINDKIQAGLENADLVIASGGSSLGREDILAKVISQSGTLLVHGIAIKPGKPTIIGIVSGKLVLGLPGYPTSALSNYHILVKPLIERVLGIKQRSVTMTATLSRKVASTIGRYEFLPVKVVSVDGGYEAVPVLKGSSAITTLAEADGFIEVAENVEVVDRGETVTVRLFD